MKAATRRLSGLDRIRGLAVALMVLDHCAVVMLANFGVQSRALELYRLTITRASLPMFMLVAGHLLGDRAMSSRRLVQVFAAGFAAVCVVQVTGLALGRPDILLVFACVMLVREPIRRYPVELGALGVVQVITWPFEGAWSGYQPGAVLALVCFGVLSFQAWGNLNELGYYLPRWCSRIGTEPLAIYLGHICVLGFLVMAWGVPV